MSRRHVVRGIVAGGIAVIVAGMGAYLWANPVDVGSPTIQFTVLTADFGLRRTPLTRSFDLYLCDWDPEVILAECPGTNVTVNGSSGPSNSEARPVRPEIVSTTVGGELVQVNNNEPIKDDGQCNRVARASQFPSSQIKAVAENRGAADLVVSLTADSSQPEEVRPGTYCGYVTVARASGPDISLYVLASVGDRGQGALRVRIFLALLGGALMGAVVKWLGDRYAPVAGLRRRQRRLMRRFGAWRRFLPERAQYNLMVVEDGIGSFDPDGVDASLNDLELQGDALTKFSSAMAELDRLLPAQEEHCDDDVEPPVSKVLAAEYSLIAGLRGEKFPWADPDDTAARADRLRNSAKAVLVALKSGDMSSYADAADDIRGSVTDDQVQRIEEAQQRRPDGYRVVTRAEPVVVIGPEPRTFAQILLDNSLLITMVAGAFVVAFVGFQSQFVGDPSFDAGNGDYLRMFAWAFALQVAGVTVLEVAGKLVTSAATGGGRPASS